MQEALLGAFWQSRPALGDFCAWKAGKQKIDVTVQPDHIHRQSTDGKLEGVEPNLQTHTPDQA